MEEKEPIEVPGVSQDPEPDEYDNWHPHYF